MYLNNTHAVVKTQKPTHPRSSEKMDRLAAKPIISRFPIIL